MATPFAIQYAIHVITDHFGNLITKVCECLLRKGPLTLANIVRFTELTSYQVKNALLVLIQHNCAQAFLIEQSGGIGEAPKFQAQYLVLFDNILHRMRFSKFLMIATTELDKNCVELLEGLMEHGRLTLQQMLDRAKSKRKDGNEVTLESLRETLLKLLTHRFVERCPAPEPLLIESEGEAPKKRGPKVFEIVKTIEQRVEYAAMPSESLRFAIINPGGEQKDEINSSKITTGKKRKNVVLEREEEDCGLTDESTFLWRANSEEFMRRLRHKVCIEKVKANIGDEAAIVLSAILEATRNDEKKLKQEYSVPLPEGSIYEEVIKNEAGQKLTSDDVRTLLDLLTSASFLKMVDESYSINFKCILESAQNDEVESTVSKRYGEVAYRIFRLLSKKDRLVETVKISNDALTGLKETPTILFRLWKDDYLHMERVTVAGSKQFMLWKVNKSTLWGHVLDEMFHSALNLSLRLAFEIEQEKEILELPEDKRTGSLGNRYKRIRKVRMLLVSSHMKIDGAIMLFHDF